MAMTSVDWSVLVLNRLELTTYMSAGIRIGVVDGPDACAGPDIEDPCGSCARLVWRGQAELVAEGYKEQDM